MSLGLKRGTVQHEPHDKLWDEIAILDHSQVSRHNY